MVKFVTNASSAIWWPKMEPILIALHVGQIWNQFWWHHLVVKFWTNTGETTYNWTNLETMQVAFYLAGKITQVKEYIPWVRCASGNVLMIFHDNEYHHGDWYWLVRPSLLMMLMLCYIDFMIIIINVSWPPLMSCDDENEDTNDDDMNDDREIILW